MTVPRPPAALALVPLVAAALAGCDRESGPGGADGLWTIDRADVFDGGPGIDGIPSVDAPRFASAAATTDVADGELVVGIATADGARAYPHAILDWHEIVNDVVPDSDGDGALEVAVTYCPLTGTAVGWDRNVGGAVTEFGVSGLLYNTNLMPYDRNTGSTWSQMRLECVNGPAVETRAATVRVVETTYATWRSMYPETEVLTRATGFARDYDRYPYGDYRTSERTLFPLLATDRRHPLKERVLGIQGPDAAYVVRFASFPDPGVVGVVEAEVGGRPVVVFGSREDDLLVAFAPELAGRPRTFVPVAREGRVIAADTDGNRYDAFGRVVDGPDAGGRLGHVDQYVGFWLAWSSFWPGVEVVGGE